MEATHEQIQHELDNLHQEMAKTRVRDGLKISIYENFTKRVGIIADMHRKTAPKPEAASAE